MVDFIDVENDQMSSIGKNIITNLDSYVNQENDNDYVEKMRVLFDDVLSRFVNEFSENKNGEKLVLAFLGDRQQLDLFKIFWAVWNRGGCDFVSRNKLWSFVAKECGIVSSIVEEYVKNVYMKYVSELDRSLRRAVDSSTKWLEEENNEYGKMSLLLLEFRKEFSDFLRMKQCSNKKKGICDDVDIVDINEVSDEVEKSQKTTHEDDEEILVAVEGAWSSKKRKSDSLSLLGMVDWVVEVAKHPNDVAIERINEYRSQALLAREALLGTRCFDLTTEGGFLQKKLKLHPSMYEEGNNLSPQSTETVGTSVRVSSGVEVLETNENDSSSEDEIPEKQISVGPFFQAVVPEWNGLVTESDSKWLGTRMWPPENEENFLDFENKTIGKGKKQFCECRFPDSVSCVRFHVSENRMKLRREIGLLLFYKWQFQCMGEEVSLSWTSEEEKRFKLMVRLNLLGPSTLFWDDVAKFFPDKTKEKLVSYYLNVFLIRRRAYQNRVTLNNIDSDDEDECELECVGGRFGDRFSS